MGEGVLMMHFLIEVVILGGGGYTVGYYRSWSKRNRI